MTEKPAVLQSVGSQSVRQDLATEKQQALLCSAGPEQDFAGASFSHNEMGPLRVLYLKFHDISIWPVGARTTFRALSELL